MLYINEVRKTVGRTALLLLLCILILNGVLIVTGERDRGYFLLQAIIGNCMLRKG